MGGERHPVIEENVSSEIGIEELIFSEPFLRGRKFHYPFNSDIFTAWRYHFRDLI